MKGRSVLVISAAPDERLSTSGLREIVNALKADPRLRVTTWFLRAGSRQEEWPDARIVDSLRSWGPVSTLRSRGLEGPANALSGMRLRLWRLKARPEVVLLDDGLGGRVLGVVKSEKVVVRSNPVAPADAGLETAWSGLVAAEIVGAHAAATTNAPAMNEPTWSKGPAEVAPRTLVPPKQVRALFGLPTDPVLLGCVTTAHPHPALLDRCLELRQHLAAELDREVHLLWSQPDLSKAHLTQIAELAKSVGANAQVHPRPQATTTLLSACDAVVATHAPAEIAALESAGVAITVVGELADPRAVAKGLDAALRINREERAAQARRDQDPKRFIAYLVNHLATLR